MNVLEFLSGLTEFLLVNPEGVTWLGLILLIWGFVNFRVIPMFVGTALLLAVFG